MKKRIFELTIISIILVGLAGIVSARREYEPTRWIEGVRDGGVLLTAQIPWAILNTALPAGEDPNALIISERTYLTVLAAISTAADDDEKISYAFMTPGWNGIRLRCRGWDDNSDMDYAIYFGTLAGEDDCELAYVGLLEFVIGQQASITTGYEIAHEVVVTAGEWGKAWSVSNPSGERVAEARIDCLGADFIVVVPVVVDSNAFLIAKGY